MRHRIGEYKFICLKETSLFAKDYLHKLFNSEIYQAFETSKATKNECIQIERSIVFYHQSVINASVTNIVDMADMLQK